MASPHILTVYFPPGGHGIEYRESILSEVSKHTRVDCDHESTLIFGDFNAQLGHVGVDEEQFVGPHVFKKVLTSKRGITSNRDILVDYCATNDMMVANTFFDYPDELLVSYYNLTSKPMDPVTPNGFCQIDHVLCGQNNADMIQDCWMSRTNSLRTHHFITFADVCIHFEQKPKISKSFIDVGTLRNQSTCDDFYCAFNNHMESKQNEHVNLEAHAQHISDAFQMGSHTLPKQDITEKRPWISGNTLDLITQRNAKRSEGDYAGECRLHKMVRGSAKADRQKYLNDEIAIGSWAAVKSLSHKRMTKHVNISNESGVIVDTEARPDTMGRYFESVQWQVRFPNLVQEKESLIHPVLPIACTNFTYEELCNVLRKLKFGKASGHDDILSEFWKHVLDNMTAAHELLGLCNHCWNNATIPKAWRLAKVVLLFKKGDATLPENYRPISLLPTGYKVLAALIHQRLLDSGVDDKIRKTQYGFRPKRNCTVCINVFSTDD